MQKGRREGREEGKEIWKGMEISARAVFAGHVSLYTFINLIVG